MRERLLNYSHHLRRLRMMVLVAVLAVPIGAVGQDPNEKLNLDFHDGLSGWRLYYGVYRSYGATSTSRNYYFNSKDAREAIEGSAFKANKYESKYDALFSGGNGDMDEDFVPGSQDRYMPEGDVSILHKSNKPGEYRFQVLTEGAADDADVYDPNFGKGNSISGCSRNFLDNKCYVNNPREGIRMIPEGFGNTCRIGASYGINSNGSTDSKGTDAGCEIQKANNLNGTIFSDVASVERMEYEFECDESMGALVVDYCAIALSPSATGGKHTESGRSGEPSFVVNAQVYKYDTINKVYYWDNIDCGNSGKTTSSMKNCNGYNSSVYHLVTTGWSVASFDLRECRGLKVRLQVTSTDCVWNNSSAGGHGGYGYFRAKIKPLEMDVKYCKSEDPIHITAPEGHYYYKWYTSSASVNSVNNARLLKEGLSSVNDIRDALKENGYKMPPGHSKVWLRLFPTENSYVAGENSNNRCIITLDTLIAPTNVEVDVVAEQICDRDIKLHDKSKVGSLTAKSSDSVSYWKWMVFPVGINETNYDETVNPMFEKEGDADSTLVYKFAEDGQYVRLHVTTKSGCESEGGFFFKPNVQPKWNTPIGVYCEGMPVEVSFSPDPTYMDEAGNNLSEDLEFTFDGEKWVNIDKTLIATKSAKRGTQIYPYQVRDIYGCITDAKFVANVKAAPAYTMLVDNGTKDLNLSTEEESIINVCPGTNAKVRFRDVRGNSYKLNAADKGQSVLDNADGFYYTDEIELAPGNTYSVLITYDGCESMHFITVKAYEDIATLINESYICAGEDAQVSVENVSLRINGVPQWYKTDDQGNKVGDAIGSGITYTLTNVESVNYYMVEATDVYGCPFTQNFSVKMKNKPEIKATFSYEEYIGSVAQNRVPLNSSYADGVYEVDPVCPNADRYKSRVWFNLENTTRIASTRYRFKDITNGESANWSGWYNAGSNDVYDGYSNGTDGRNRVILVEAQSYEGGVNYCTDTIKVILQSYPKSSCALTVADFRYENNAIIPGTNTTSIYCEGTDVVLSPIHKSGPSIAEGADADVRWYDNKYDHATNKDGWNEVTADYESAVVVDGKLTVKAVTDNYNRLDSYGRQYRPYRALVKDVNGCYAELSANVYVKPLPELSLDKSADVVCEGNSISLSVVDKHAGETFKHDNLNNTIGGYLWSETRTDKDGNEVKKVLNGNNSDAHFVDMKGNSVMVKVEVTASNGCLAADSTILKSHPAFDIIMQNDAVVCSRPNGSVAENAKVELKFAAVSVEGGSALTAQSFTYKVTHKQTGADGYVVTDVPRGQSADLGEFEVSDTYLDEVVEVIEVEVTSSEGCVVKKKFEITVMPYPKVYITADKDFVCDGTAESLVLTANNGSSNVVQNPVLSWLNIAGNVAGEAATALTGTVSFVKNDEGFVDYVAKITSDKCVAYDTFRVYSQDKPDFTVNSVPSSVCENALFTSVLSASANSDSTYFYTQLGKNGNDATWSSAWTEDAVVDGGVSSAKYDVSKQVIMGSASKTFTVRAGMARYGNAGLYRTPEGREDISNYFCYSENTVTIGSNKVPGVTAVLLSSANSANKADVICNYKDYYLLVTNQSSSLNIVDVTVNVEGVEKVASLAGGGSAVVGPFTPNSNASASTINEDKVVLSWKDRVTDCENKSYMTVNFVERPKVFILKNGEETASEEDVCEGSILNLSYRPDISSGASVSSSVWSYGTVSDNNASIQVTASMLQPSLSYNVKIVDSYGCEAESSVKINVNEAPKFTAWLTSQDTGVCEGGTDSLIVSDNNNLESGYSYVAYVYDVATNQRGSEVFGKEIEVNEPVLDAEGKQEKDGDGNPLFSVKKYYLFELNGLMGALTYRVEAKSKALTGCSSYKDVTTKVNKLPVLDIKMTNATTGDSDIEHVNGKFPAVCQNDQVQFVISNTTADPSVSTTYKLRRVTANALYDKYGLVTASGPSVGTTEKIKVDNNHMYEITATTSSGCEVVTLVEVPIKSNVSLVTKGNHSSVNNSYLCRDKADNENLVTLDGDNHMFQIWIDNTSNLSKDNKKWTITGNYINGAGSDYDDIKFDLTEAYKAFGNVANPDLDKTSTTFKLSVTDNQGCLREVTHNVRFLPDPDFGKILYNVSPDPVCSENGKVEVSLENTEVVSYANYTRTLSAANYTHALSDANLGKSTGKTFKEEMSFAENDVVDNKLGIELHAAIMQVGYYKYTGKNLLCKSSKEVSVGVTYNPDFDVVMKNNDGNDISGKKLCIGDNFYFEMTNGRTDYQGKDIDYAVYELWYDADRNLNEKLVANVRGGFGSPIATNVNGKLFVADSTKRYKIVAKADDACSEVVKYLGVDVDKPFKVNVSGPLSMCSRTTAVLSAPAGYTAYQWCDANGQNIVSDGTSKDYKISNGGTYSVKVQNANGCWSDLSEGFTVEEHKLPVLGQPEGLSACVGSVAEIKANVTNDVAVKSFKWYKLDESGNRVGNALTDSDGKSDVLTVPVTGNARYEYVAISDHCASDPEKFEVIGLNLPDIQVLKGKSTTLTTCAGTSLTLNAVDNNSPSTKFIWLDNNGDTLSKSDVWVVEKPMDVRQVHFKVKAIGTNTCVNTVPFVYDVLTVPNLDIDGLTACQGVKSELTVRDINEDPNKPTTYKWTGGVEGPTYELINPAATNKVQVTATHGNGCTRDSFMTIVADALPTASISVVSRECNEVKLKAETSVADVVWYVGSYDENNNLVWVKDANGNNKPHYQNQDVISVVVDKKMAYQIYVQDGTCSKESDVFDLDHYATPSFDIANVEVCQGDPATLTAQNISGVDNFFWSDKRADPAFTDKLGDGHSLVVTPSESLSDAYYSVYGTNMNRCTTDVKTVKVTVHAKPKVLLATANGGPSMRCLNDQKPLKLKASVGVGHDAKKIQWNNVGGYKDVTADEDLLLDYMNSVSSTVNVSIEDQNQCIGDTFITVTVVANPKIDIDERIDPFCAGEMAKLSARVQFSSPATKATCVWKDQAGNVIGSQTDHFVRLPDNDSGENFPLALTYTVEATDDMSCKSQATVTLNVVARPTITVSGEKMICPNTDAVLTLGGADYFYVDGQYEISGKNPSYRKVLSRPHTFEVYGFTDQCMSDKVTFDVNVRPAPVIAIEETGKGLGDNLQGQTRNACEGDNLSLKAKASGGSGSGYVYAWGLNNTDFDAANAAKGLQLTGRQDNAYKTYVYAKDGEGCIAETWVEFIANPLPVAYIKSDKDAVCDVTEEVVLKACNAPNATFENCQGFPENIEYEWSYTKEGVNKGLGNKSEAIVSDVNGKVTVNLKVTDVNNLCFSNVTKDIDKNELPQFTVKNGLTDIFADNNGVVKICEGAYADLVAVQNGGNVALSGTTWSYYSNGQMVTADGAFFQTNAFDKGTSDVQYKVTVDGTNGCSATKDFKISVKPLPTITIRGPLDPVTKLPTTACYDSKVEFRAVSEYNGVDFAWTSPQNKPGDALEFTAGQLGNTVAVTATLDGCVNTASLNYQVHHAPDISIESSAKKTDNTVCEGSYVKLMPKNNTVSSQNNVTWVWTDAESGKEVSMNDVCEIPNLFKTTKYTLTGVERGVGCKATAQVTINVKAKPIIGAYFKSGDKRGDTICSNATNVQLALSNDATYYLMSGGSVFNDYSAEEIKDEYQITDFVAGMRNEYTIRAFAEKEYDAGGTLTCTADTTIGLTVFAAPTVSIAAANVYCPDQEIKMTALGADEYVWGGLGVEGSKESSIKVTPESYDDILSFSVTGTKVVYKKGDDEFKCSTTVTKDVTVLDKYDLEIEAQKPTVCYGDKAVLKVLYDEGDYTKFYWSTYQSGETTEKLIMSASQFITVEATDRNKCRVKDSIEIKGQDPDNFNFVITNPTPVEVCENDPLVLKVSGADENSHVWDFDPTVTTNQLAVPTKSNGIYRVKGTLEECTKELVIPVTVKAAPAIAISGDVIVCREGTLDLTASSVVPDLQLQFQWNVPDNAADPAKPWHLILNNVSKDESYKVTAISTDPTVCKAEEVVKVKVRENPKVSIEGDNTVCNNTYADLTATGAVNYVWGYYDENGVKQDNKGGGDNYQPRVGDADLKVFVTGYDAYNCVGSVNFDIRSVPTPKFEIVTDNGVDVVCEDEFVKLKASANSQVTDVVWNGKDTFAAGTLYHSAPLKNSREFYAMGYSEEGCAAYATKEIKVLRKPVVAINGNTTLCQNDMLKVKAIGADSYTWGTGQSSGDNNEFMEVVMNEPGTKQISVTGLVIDAATKKTCPSTGVFDIVVKKTPVVRIEAEDQTCANVALPLKAVTDDEDVTSFTWSNDVDKDFNLSGQDIKAVIADKDVWFTVSAGTSYGCVGTARHLVDVVSSPTFEIASNIDFGKPMGDGKLEFNDLGIAYVDVCDGSKLNLQIVSGANTFKWNHREKVDTNFTSLDTTIATSATFVVTGYITGCEASRTIVVNHKNNPVIDVVGKRVVCEGSLVTLEPIGADSFLWRGDAVVPDENGKKVISFVPTSNEAKYVLLGIDTTTNCQTSRTYADIKFTSKPKFTVSGDKYVCVNESIVLNASAVDPANDEENYSYNWGFDKDAKRAIDLDSELEITAFEAGVDKYFASVKDSVGCVDTLFFEVTKKPLPTLTFDAKGSDNDPSTPEIIDICMKNDLYAYINSGGASVTQENGKVSSTIKDKPVKDTIYKVTGTLNGCVNTLEIPVRTIPSPIVYLTNYAEDEELTYCEGSPVKLVVGGNAVSYIMPDGTKGANGATYVDEKADGLMTYFITGEGDNGCSVQEEFTFKMNALPEVAIDIEKDQDRICYREVAELHVTGAESYKWSTGSRKDTIKATITKDSLFTVVGKDANGCESEVSFKVTMVELPVLAYNGDTEFCDGNTATLRGSGTGVGGGDYYAWSIGKDTIAMGNLATTTLNGNTTYTLWGKSKEGCVSSLDVDITAKEAPILFWEGEYELNETADSILLCQKQTLDITMKGADTYQWTGGSTTDRLTVVPTRSTHYTVTGTGANGCKTTQAINVKVLPTPTIKIDAPTFACVGEDFQMKVTDDTKDNFESFAWSNHSTEATSGDLTMTEEDYTLKVTGYTSLNCPAEASFTVKPKALPKLYVRGTKEICKGGVFSLHGQGANTYAWFMDENDYYGNDTAKVGDQISFEAATDEVLVMSGTLNGCTDTIHVPLSVQTPPILHTEGLKPICQGEVLELIAKATNVNEEDKVEFSWSAGSVSGELGDTMRMTPLSSQEIYLTGSVVLLDENGEQIYCKNTLEIPVTVNTKPTIEVEGERTVCYGTEAKFTAVGAAAYEWVELESSSETVRPIITSDTSLTVRGKDTETGCDAEAVVKVKVKPLPVLGVANGSKVILCDGEEADITVFGAATYGWRQPDGSLVAGNRYKHTPEQDTIYRVIGTSNNNCVDSMDIEVTVNMLPSLSYSGDSEICSGDSLILFGHSAPEGCTFVWSNGDKGDKMEAKPLVSASYKLTGTDANGCFSTIEIPVVVNQRIPLALAGPASVCEGSQAKIYAKDAKDFVAFNWSNGNVGDTIRPDVLEKTTFFVDATDGNGCVTRAEFTVDAISIPELAFSGDTVVCLGEEVSLLADGARDYIWKDVDGNVLYKGALYKFVPEVATKLILEGYLSDCKSEREIPITVNAVPNLVVEMPEFICRGSVGELRASAGAGATFLWSTGETEKNIEVTPLKSTAYTVTATNEYGCDSSKTEVVLVVEPPKVLMGTSKDMVCPDQADSVYFSATGAVSYEWSSVPAVADIDIYNSDKQNFWAVLNEGEDVAVTVVGTDEKGCETKVTKIIAQRELEPMQFIINPNCIDATNPEVRFSGKVPDHEDAVWTWTPGEGLDPVTISKDKNGSMVYRYDLPLKDSFEVKVHSVDEHGCIQEGSGWVYKWRDFWAAEAFTPDGDGLNDEFYFHGGDFIEEFSYIIYNRMGEIIYEGKSIEDKWDGNYKGEPCPTGVYGWTAKYGNNSATLSKKGERKGMVTIVR